LADIFPLFAYKKEELVLLDRSVEVPAEIVEPQFRSYGREETTPVKLVIAKEFKSAAVKSVATAARDNIDGCSGVATIFSGKVGGLDLDFLDEVNSDVVDLTVVAAGIHIEAAINREVVVIGSIPIDSRLANAQTGGQR